jgi:hypothetical protein
VSVFFFSSQRESALEFQKKNKVLIVTHIIHTSLGPAILQEVSRHTNKGPPGPDGRRLNEGLEGKMMHELKRFQCHNIMIFGNRRYLFYLQGLFRVVGHHSVIGLEGKKQTLQSNSKKQYKT